MRPRVPLAQRLKRYRLLWVIAITVFLLDQLTKYWISEVSGFPRGAYPPWGGIEIIPGFFSIVYTINKGAAWGLFAGQTFWLAILGLVAVGVIYAFRRHLELELRYMQLAFGLLSGGIVGNLVDRALHGHVVDFLDFHLGFYRWPTFNIADCGIVVGVVLYSIYSIFLAKDDKKKRVKVPLF